MRRIFPYVITALVLLGAAGGAVAGSLGSPNGSPSGSPSGASNAWLSSVVRATEAAGTAHVAIRIESSGGPPSSVGHATGVVNFAASSYRFVGSGPAFGAGNGTSVVTVVVGNRTYVGTSLPGSSRGGTAGTPYEMIESSQRSSAFSPLLLSLGHLTAGEKVRDLGSSPRPIEGQTTTGYRITLDVHPICSDGAAEHVDVWVDKLGRILRETTTSVVNSPPPEHGGATVSRSRSRTVSAVTFSDFGSPVAVSAPSHVFKGPSNEAHSSNTVSARCTR